MNKKTKKSDWAVLLYMSVDWVLKMHKDYLDAYYLDPLTQKKRPINLYQFIESNYNDIIEMDKKKNEHTEKEKKIDRLKNIIRELEKEL